jgi:hypothetical protein
MEREAVPTRGRPRVVVALLGVAAVVVGAALLITIVSTIGLAGAGLLACVLASFAVVLLAILRRRPIDVGGQRG